MPYQRLQVQFSAEEYESLMAAKESSGVSMRVFLLGLVAAYRVDARMPKPHVPQESKKVEYKVPTIEEPFTTVEREPTPGQAPGTTMRPAVKEKAFEEFSQVTGRPFYGPFTKEQQASRQKKR